MSQNYSLHFYLKKPKNYQNGPKFIYMRISAGANDTPKDTSIGRMIEPEQWHTKANRAKGVNDAAKMLNSYLEAIERNIEQIHTYFEKHQLEVTAENLLNKYLGKGEVQRHLLAIFGEHNEKMKASIGKGFKANTLKGYVSSVNHLTEYMQLEFKSKDINIRKIDHAFFISKMLKLKGIRKVLLIEECWKAIAKEGMAEYIKYLFKTVRKHFGEAIVVTQEIDDIISSPIVKQAIINNSDCKILLDQSKYQNKFDQIQELLGLTDKEKVQVLSMNKANDPKRKYKEVFISIGGQLSKVYRTEVSLEEYLVRP